LFYERVDAQRVGEKNVPEYGTPHPDSRAWPHHKLVLITSSDAAGGQDQQGRFFRYYYAAERDNQDEYNFEYGNIELGGRMVDTITRTYVVLRSNFDPAAANLEIGSTMPDIPEGKFSGTWKLYDVTQKRIGEQELESLFVVLQLVYAQPNTSTGVSYGEIVTINDAVTTIVPDDTAVDTGINIISSRVEPLGNGLAVKTTRQVTSWPDPIQVEFGKDPVSPPSKYLDYVTRQTTTKKVATIPDSVVLTGNQVGKSYNKETPDRAEERTVSQEFSLNMTGVEEQIQQRPFVKVTTTVTPSPAPSLPTEGNGSSSIVYRSGNVKLYENAVEVAEARVRTAGQEKDKKPFIEFTTTKRYDTDGTVNTATGSSNIVYDDGVVTVFEVNEITASIRNTTKGIETKAQSWGSITDTITYTSSATPPAGGSTTVVYSDGDVTVYEASAITVATSGGTTDIDATQWGSITWDGTYSSSSSGLRSRQVWSNGVTNVYLNENPTVNVTGDSFTSSKEVNPLTIEEDITTYGTTSVADADNSRSRLIYQLNGIKVYENTVTTITPASAVKTYGSVVRYDIPSELLGFNIFSFDLRNGGVEFHFNPIIREGYSGSFPCTVTEYYTDNPVAPSISDIQPFKPAPVAFTLPWCSVNIGATLHQQFTIPFSTGTRDPRYKYIADTIIIPATTPPSASGLTFIAKIETMQYKNGYIVREYRITT
jgi:hypothetical protein